MHLHRRDFLLVVQSPSVGHGCHSDKDATVPVADKADFRTALFGLRQFGSFTLNFILN